MALLGISVTGVSDFSDLSRRLAEELPDVIMIDLDAGTSDGIRWVEQISADECTSHIPIMCVSSHGDLAEVEGAYKAGASSFLVAPYDPVVLESKLEALLSVSGSSREHTKTA